MVSFSFLGYLPTSSAATNGGQMKQTDYSETFQASRGNTAQKTAGVMEKNLNQMVKALRNRISNLESKMKLENELLGFDCPEDISKMSEDDLKRGTKDLPKFVDEAEEEVPKSLREIRQQAQAQASTNNTTATNTHGKENLVSSDTIFIDQYHLVLRSKAPTEVAKRIETMFASGTQYNTRDPKKKTRNGGNNQSEQSKKEEQLKNETKRNNRIKLERRLQSITENFPTRDFYHPKEALDRNKETANNSNGNNNNNGLLDVDSSKDKDKDEKDQFKDYTFRTPENVHDPPIWPIAIKWCARDPRAATMEMVEGALDPDLLLRYALERINLPSGRKLFTALIKQPLVQSYFVSLFWLIKVKFFENDAKEQIEAREMFLLRLLSLDYRQFVEMLALRTHAEHEKDFVFKYLPFILTNAVFYAFHYIFPGSRHAYSIGFKKTVYMQIVQVMHGFQVCQISVKVSWAKLFPDDVHDESAASSGVGGAAHHGGGATGGDDGIEGGEVFPIQSALRCAPIVAASEESLGIRGLGGHTKSALQKKKSTALLSPLSSKQREVSTAGSSPGSTAENDNYLWENGAAFDSNGVGKGGMFAGDEGAGEYSRQRTSSHQQQHSSRPLSGPPPLPSPKAASQRGLDNTFGGESSQSTLSRHTNTALDDDNETQQHLFPGNTQRALPGIGEMRVQEMMEKPQYLKPVAKTYLKPPIEKPVTMRKMAKRQSHVERLNAQQLSPQMSFFLSSMKGGNGGTDSDLHFAQKVRRTIPVAWCPAGGSDTHHRTSISIDAHHEIASKLKQANEDYLQITQESFKDKIRVVEEMNGQLHKVLNLFSLQFILF